MSSFQIYIKVKSEMKNINVDKNKVYVIKLRYCTDIMW